MKCIIRIVDGQPFEHPIMVDNFQQAFPEVDLNQPLPEGFAWFDRKLRPQIQEHEVFVDEQSLYEFDGTIWTDVWRVRDKTEDEIRAEVAKAYEMLKKYVSSKILSLADDPEGAAVWSAYFDLLDSYEDLHPLDTKMMPPHPYKNTEGIWISITNPGSAPNVIG